MRRPFRIEGERRSFATLEAAAYRAAQDRCPPRYQPSFPVKPGTTHVVTVHENSSPRRMHLVLTNGMSYMVERSVAVDHIASRREPVRDITRSAVEKLVRRSTTALAKGCSFVKGVTLGKAPLGDDVDARWVRCLKELEESIDGVEATLAEDRQALQYIAAALDYPSVDDMMKDFIADGAAARDRARNARSVRKVD